MPEEDLIQGLPLLVSLDHLWFERFVAGTDGLMKHLHLIPNLRHAEFYSVHSCTQLLTQMPLLHLEAAEIGADTLEWKQFASQYPGRVTILKS